MTPSPSPLLQGSVTGDFGLEGSVATPEQAAAFAIVLVVLAIAAMAALWLFRRWSTRRSA